MSVFYVFEALRTEQFDYLNINTVFHTNYVLPRVVFNLGLTSRQDLPIYLFFYTYIQHRIENFALIQCDKLTLIHRVK